MVIVPFRALSLGAYISGEGNAAFIDTKRGRRPMKRERVDCPEGEVMTRLRRYVEPIILGSAFVIVWSIVGRVVIMEFLIPMVTVLRAVLIAEP